jgi:sugar diacid utilization regulator
LTQRRDFSLEEQVNSLLDASLPPEHKKRKAKEINPFFHSNIICCYCTPKKINWKKDLKAPELNPKETVFSMIDFRQGILLIYTAIAPSFELEAKLNAFLEKIGINKTMNSIGFSSPVRGLENLGFAIQESLYAHSSSKRNQLKSVSFTNTGMDRIILPIANNFWTKRYYESHLKRLTDYDEQHGSKLLETLLAYIECDGDIKLTAQMLYQHGNTIRYRIDKIRKLLMLEANAASFAQLYTFTLLHRIYQEEE